MANKSDAIVARAVLDFDKQYSIKQVKDIAKESEKILKNISKTGKNPLVTLNKDYGVYGKLIKQGKEYKELVFSIGQAKKELLGINNITPERMKEVYGVDFKDLEEGVKKYTKLYEKAKAFNDLVNSMKVSVNRGEQLKLSDIREAKDSYFKIQDEFTKQGIDTSEIAESFDFLEEYENNYKSTSQKLAKILEETLSPSEKRALRLKAVLKELEEAEQSFLKLGMAGESTTDAENKIRSLRKEVVELKKQTEQTQLQKLFKTIKRVGFYRIARNLFRIIEHGFMDGINALIEFDDRANKTFSSISTSFDLIRSSIALSILPIVEMIAPKFEEISSSIASFAEGISKASSALRGVSTYTKISKEYMRDLREEANKTSLSFDKFESLNAKANPYETGEMTPEEMDDAKLSTEAQFLKTIKGVVETIWELLKSIGATISKTWKAIEPELQPFLKVFADVIVILSDIFVWLFKAFTSVLTWAKNNGILKETIIGVGLAIVGLKLTGFIANLTSIFTKLGKIKASAITTGAQLTEMGKQTSLLGTAFKTVGTIALAYLIYKVFDKILDGAPKVVKAITGIVGAVLALAGAIYAVKTGGNPIALVAFALGAGAFLASIKSLSSEIEIPQYANGGLVDSGSLFVAGEAGAELVTTMPSGQTGVTNIAQFKQAMVEAIYECSDVFQQSGESVVLNLDGAEIARSKSFKSELNRTNSGLNLR